MNYLFHRAFALSFLVSIAVGCGDGDDDAPADASMSIDATTAVDAETSGDASPIDATAPGDDASDLDGSAPGDDASETVADASGGDGCVAPRCPPIPVGCESVGGTECTCGTIVCAATPCEPACAGGLYCMYPTHCGGEGACTSIPDACTDEIDPVCGCDGVTYSNACEAAAAGQSVARDGECAARPDCRTEECRAGTSCQACETPRGGVSYVCIPEGAAC
jgi:hypothetical protein